jgi:hypothetical protein
MKHISTPPKSRRIKPHYEHVADKKRISIMEAFARIGYSLGQLGHAFSTGISKGVSDARQRNAHTEADR